MLSFTEQFQNLLSDVKGQVQSSFPIEGRKRTLRANNVRYDDAGTERMFDWSTIRKIKDNEGTFSSNLRGDLELVDNETGKVIDSQKNAVLARVPHMTGLGSFVINGKDLQIVNQLRRRPGIYPAFTPDDNVRTKLTSTGADYDVILDRATGQYLMKVGTSNLKLVPFLEGIGVKPQDIKSAIGEGAYADNVAAGGSRDEVLRFWNKVRSKVPSADRNELVKDIHAFMESKPLDPDVSQETIGVRHDKISANALVDAMRAAKEVAQGKRQPADMESLSFKSIHSVEDFVGDRLRKSLPGIKRSLGYIVDRVPKIRSIIGPEVLSKPIMSQFTTSEFTRYADQNNPMDILSNLQAVTVMGEGGISSIHRVTDEVRNIHSTHLGFIDPVHTAENCYHPDMEVMTKAGWMKWPEVVSTTELACLSDDGRLEYHRPEALHANEFKGDLVGFKSSTIEMLVTPQHRMWVRPPDDGLSYRFESALEVSKTYQRKIRCGGHLASIGLLEKTSVITLPFIKRSNAAKDVGELDTADWAEFLGWYFSEGSTAFVENKLAHVLISQHEAANPEKVSRIHALLDRLGFNYRYQNGKDFFIHSRQLVDYLLPFGKYCHEKTFPADVLQFPADARERFVEAMMLGDGREDGRSFCTTSRKMAEDFSNLLFTLGTSSRVTFSKDERPQAKQRGIWIVHLHVGNERDVKPTMKAKGHGFYTFPYSGKVYCATVPGGRLYVRMNGKGGHWNGNSLIGLSNHLTEGVTKKGNHLYRQVYDVKQKKMVQKSPVDLARAVVAFPDEYKVDDPKRPKTYTPIKSKVLAMNKGQFNEVSSKAVDYIIPTTSAPFSFATNAVPFLHSNSGARMLMAGRHMEQAVPLVERDVPLVQSEYHGHPYNDVVGAVMLTKARKPGVVSKVGPEEIHILHDGEKKATAYQIPDHYALNSEAFMTETPIVKVGDRVKANQAITDSNFSKNQSLAVGKNLITAFMPWKGYNFEDGIVISESAAKKLASEHKHELKVEKDQNTAISAKKLFAQFPHLKTPDAWAEDREDLPKVGDVIKPGQIIIPAITKNVLGPQTEYDRIHKALTKPFKDSSIRWMEMVDGEVVRVVNNPNFTKVYVKTREPMVIGDKLSTRHGSKGIVTKIVPDNEMPRNEEGNTVDVLFNPYGIPGRMNPGIMFETAMGKVAQKTGKNITVKNFGNLKSQVKHVKEQLKQHNLSDTETVWDPTHNKSHEKILTGPLHWIKLKHQVRNKLSARGHQDAYTIDGRPAKGGTGALDESTSAQSVGPLEIYSLMAGGQTEFLKDVAGLKSNRNVDYWNAYQLGLPTPPPMVPQVLDKFHKYMQGAGVNLRMEGNTIKALPMTDKDILARSKGAITEPTVVRTSGAHLIEEKGGLFDRSITGGTAGKENNWAHIELAEPVLHPLYEAPAMALTGLKKKEFEGILSGKIYVDTDGNHHNEPGEGRVTAGIAMERLLGKINVEPDLRSAQAKLRSVNKTDRPKLMKKIRYLTALQKMNLSPKDAFINKYLPVIPPSARPVYAMGDGNLNVADPNHGYREVLFVNRALQDLKKAGVSDDLLQPQREGLYKSVAGLVGLTEPMTRNANFKGFISAIAGQQNKFGLFQAQVVKRTQDLTGRSTIIVDPSLHVDEIGVPFKMAQKIFAPFAIRQMVTSFGLKPIDARTELEEMTPRAQKVLENIAAERPVIMNRAPSLHKFSTVAVKAKLVPGQAIQVNPLIVGGLNADFDGDTAAIHVPVSEKARLQSWEKLPSRTLLSPKDLSVIHGPAKEALYGLYAMTNPSSKKAVSVKSPADVLKMVQSRKLDMNDPVHYQNKTWTAGHFVINNDLPKEYQIDNQPLTGGRTKDLINRMAKDANLRGKAGDLITKLKDHGFTHATTLGTSISLDDLTSAQLDAEYNKIIPKVNQLAKKDPLKAISWGSEHAGKAMEQLKNNRLAELTYKSGAGGKYKTNVQQMVLAPIGVQDVKGNVVPVPITRGYAEGMNLGSYWATLPGMRKGIADRALATADTGAFAKELQNTTIHMRIVEDDCGTTDGIDLPIGHPDLQGRFMASNGRLLDGSLMKSLRSKNVKTIKVRSPATCHAHSGICAKCMGLNESGQLYNKGFHVGTLVGTTISEPLTQMVMRCNAGENLVTVRISGKVRVAALHQLWDELSGTVHEDDGVELKQVSGVDVWDGNQWTEVYFIERHDPDDELVLQLLENGRALVAQKNHPTWARKQKIVCGCGSTSFTELGRSSYLAEGSVKKVYTQCDRCGERADIPESEWLEFVETVVDLGDSTGLFIQTHAPLDPAECTPPVAPYVAGIFVAEGHVERRKYGDIQRGRRAGGNIPYAMKSALPIAFSVTQNPGEGQNFILDKLAEYKTSVSGKTIRVHDGKLAASFLDWFGSGARNKQIPAAWLGAPKSWLIDFLSGVIDGDGTIDSQSNRVCLDTTSLTLANQVAWIAERLGGRSRMYTTPWREHSKHQGYRVDLYLPVQLTGFKKIKLAVRKEFDDLSQVNDLKDVVYSGKVYDLATATRRFTANGVVTHNSFHTGGAVGGTEVGYKRISQIFNMPANMRGKAPLASRDGVVENIVDTDRGGYEVHIDGVKHFVPTELDLSVKVGDKIKAGDKLSRHGVTHPRELAQYKGIEAARDLLLNDIDSEMRLSGQNIRRRVFESAIRPLIDKSIVVDPGDAEKEHDIQPGDVMSSNYIRSLNKKLKNPIKAEPHLMSVKEVPFTSSDFIGPLMAQRLPRTLKMAPALGAVTKLKGFEAHPIVEFAYGKMATDEGLTVIWDEENDD